MNYQNRKKLAAFVFVLAQSSWAMDMPVDNELTPPTQIHSRLIAAHQKTVDMTPELFYNFPADIRGVIHQKISFLMRMKLRMINKTTRNVIDKSQENGPYLEELVFWYSRYKKISLSIIDTSRVDNHVEGDGPCPMVFPSPIFPSTINEMHRWCATGYQLPKHTEFNGDPNFALQLFHKGIKDNYRPFVLYVLEEHSHVLTIEKVENLKFKDGNVDFLLITYLFKKDYFHIFDLLVKNKTIRERYFGEKIKNSLGNTPLHSVVKFVSEAMIKKFLEHSDLLELCLTPENIKGEKGKNPLEIADIMKRPQTIKDILLANDEVRTRCRSGSAIG